MVKKIRWTPKAIKSYSQIILYLRNEWSEKVAKNFGTKLHYKLLVLVDFPFIGSASGIKHGFNKLIITKHNSLYYRVKKNEIIILNIYDNRKDPGNQKF